MRDLDDLVDIRLESSLRSWIEEAGFDAVVAEHVYASRVLEWVPSNLLRILDTHDVFALGKSNGESAQSWLGISAEQEEKGLGRADIVWAIQEHDAAVLKSHSTGRVFAVGHIVREANSMRARGSVGDGILFVGSQHFHNVEGMRRFTEKVWPKLADLSPAPMLAIVGDIYKRLSRKGPFRFVGAVREVGPYYSQCRVVIGPVYGGTGLKIKNIEAMAHGCPVVTTPEGAWGLESAEGHGLVIARNDDEFALAVRQFLLNPNLARSAGEKARKFATDWNHRQKMGLIASFTHLEGSRVRA